MGNLVRRVGVASGVVVLAAAAGVTVTPATSSADAGSHQVQYTVTTTSELKAQIYYLGAEPPSRAVYDADPTPYLASLTAYVVGPDAPWVFQTTLNDTTQWAYVSASGGLRVNPEFHCEIAVDGVVVVSEQGGSGVQCALRPW